MNNIVNNPARDRKTKLPYVLALCVGGLLINLLLSKLALRLDITLYLDSIGTILAAALGGYIPGIAVGFLTNIINGISDYTTTYYSSLNVMIAVSAAYFAQKGYFKKPLKMAVAVIVFSLIGGGIGSVLTWMLYGFDFGGEISAPLARSIYEHSFLDKFWAEFCADMLVDVADKVVTVGLVALVLNLLPKNFKDRFYTDNRLRVDLKKQSQKAGAKRFSRRLSLRSKILLLVAAATLIIAIVVSGISFILFRDAAVEQQSRLGYGVTNLVTETLDAERVDDYIRLGEQDEAYRKILDRLSNIMNSSPDIEYAYVYRILENGCQVVFDPDSEELKGHAAGQIIPFDESFRPYLPALLAGEAIDPIISDDTYGWLLTIYQPVYDAAGVCQCYAAVDISMEQLMVNEYRFLARVVSLFFGFFVLILAVGMTLAENNLILPINGMALAAGAFAYNSEEAREDSVERLKALDIQTGDEIENLYHALTQTTDETMRYVSDVQKQGETISKLQNGLIMVLADMVESRDKCTGDHVRKTAAYARIIMEQMRKEGVYADQLTDAFIDDVVNSAPLHDVGKIKVSDVLLNKPGKLTDEEFAEMKTHTTAGSEIIAQAMDVVGEGDTGYLREAQNLAAYHHEKWNGTGYPCGLAGEQIPLSARIMAVADVFDALVSRRSYKPGFPFDKSMDIIREGMGSHFDPQVAKAFLDAEDEVRRVSEMHLG